MLDVPLSCEGCGSKLDTEVYARDAYITVDVAPERRVYVCSSRRGGIRGAKEACLYAALEKNKLCPGCGKELHYWPLERLCEDCGKKLDLADEIQADKRLKRESFVFKISDAASVTWHESHGAEAHKCLAEVVRRVAAAASAKKPVELINGETYRIRVTARQLKRMGRIAKSLKDLWNVAKAIGYEEGRNLLMGLATGKVTPDQFSEKEIARAQKTQDPGA